MTQNKILHRWILCFALVNVVIRCTLAFVGCAVKHDRFPPSASDQSSFPLALSNENGQSINMKGRMLTMPTPPDTSVGLTDEEFLSWLSTELADAHARVPHRGLELPVDLPLHELGVGHVDALA